jgi:hypothetical protein
MPMFPPNVSEDALANLTEAACRQVAGIGERPAPPGELHLRPPDSCVFGTRWRDVEDRVRLFGTS